SAIFFTYAGLVMAIYGLLTGMAISANEEEEGILDVVLSLPVGRTQLIVERIAAHAVISVGIVIVIFLSLYGGALITGVDMNAGLLLAGSINLLPMTLFMIAMSAFAAASLRRRSTALGIVTAYIVASYIIAFIVGSIDSVVADAAGYVSFYTYYASEKVMQQGLIPLFVFILLLVGGLFLWAALRSFDRRDIGV
ncbi:MAG: ABC transporter permease subunit, partial [Anaerolineae bacterium]|nr:ABC transporter permease subunit [Anaerolineae bacterium]